MPNQYEIPPMSVPEKRFILSAEVRPDLIRLYEKIRERVLRYGKIEVWTNKDYIKFTHPYRKGSKIGTLLDVVFKDDSIELFFNTMGELPNDPHGILEPRRFGVCHYRATIEPTDNLDHLDKIIEQTIYFMSKEARIVRVGDKYITIGAL